MFRHTMLTLLTLLMENCLMVRLNTGNILFRRMAQMVRSGPQMEMVQVPGVMLEV